MRKIFLIFSCFLIGILGFSYTISGYVDDANQNAIPGVNILVNGQPFTFSNTDGSWSVQSSGTVKIEPYLKWWKFDPREVTLDNSQTNVDFVGSYTGPELSEITVGTSPDAGFFDPKNGMVYVADNLDNSIVVINGQKDTFENVFQNIPVGVNPSALAINPDTGLMYIANESATAFYSIGIYNTVKNRFEGSIPLNYAPGGIGIDQKTDTLYVTESYNSAYYGNRVDVIDLKTNSIIGRINVGNDPCCIFVDQDTNRIYVVNNYDNTLSVIDGNNVIATIPVGQAPLSVCADKDKIYVANSGDNTVSVISANTYELLKTIPVGIHPSSVVIDPKDDLIFVANTDSNSVSVIDGSTDRVISVIPDSYSPYSLVINFAMKKLYMINQKSNNVTVVDYYGI
ncbi:YncE family protein [Athalassotoga saccharophila]|uniref:PE-PGRS family protein PE_PGRS18 n=1 Tax=Athalassotoga saccharophila TaxID=1441386 RepID=A0A6N4TE96_9BACT|nr:YncE family protein [Athalassotoga saccharophila]BBJ29099.1 PE-PGRS family protein PE_PGRS18 [Athalassotoga saccharophila]